jgi:15-cis-phytoene desaturase
LVEPNDGGTVETDVLIVGGGLAGITSAMGLLEQGYEVTLVERDERLGGRARSWRDEKTGDPVHIGPHIILSEYPNFLDLLDRLGNRNQIVWEEDRFVTVVDGQKQYPKRQSTWLPAPFIYVPSELRDDAYDQEDVLSNIPVLMYALQLDDDDIQRLDNVNAYALLKSFGVSEKFIDAVWRFTSRAIMNVPLEYCSAGALLNFYRYFVGYGSYEVGFPREGLGELFAPEAEDYLRNHENATLELETEVDELIHEGDRIHGAQLNDGRTVQADRTILGLTVPQLQTMIPREWSRNHDYFGELGYLEPCRYICPYLWFDRELTDLRFWARRYNYSDLNCDFYDLSNISPDVNDGNSLITSNIIYTDRLGDLSDEEIVRETRRELAEFLPEARDAELKHSVVNRVPLAIHSPFPGTQQRRPTPDTPVENLYLAGDWIDTGLPSSMESATKSGWMVTDAIVDEDGGESELTQPIREVEGIAKLIKQAGQWGPLRKARKWIPPFDSK